MASIRTEVIYSASAIASGTTGTETAITLTKALGTSANSSAVSFAPTNGKTFSITGIHLQARGHATATAQVTTFSLRINTAGAVATNSTPILLKWRLATPATANAIEKQSFYFQDPYQITGDGTLQFGITANSVFVTNAPTWDVVITGYEY